MFSYKNILRLHVQCFHLKLYKRGLILRSINLFYILAPSHSGSSPEMNIIYFATALALAILAANGQSQKLLIFFPTLVHTVTEDTALYNP